MAEKFTQHTGLVVPLDAANVDTDAIIPKQFLQKVTRTGFGAHLFNDWRFLDDKGEQPNPEFVLNFPEYKGASILLARENFGCGSSREHAAITLKAVGAGAVLAESFGRIFFRNAINLGVPVITCSEITKIIAEGDEVEVDIEAGIIKNLTTGATAAAVPMSPYIMNILQSGGIKPMIKAMQETKKSKNR